MGKGRKSFPRNLNARLRREYILLLRVSGATYGQIAEQVRLRAKKEGWVLPKGYDRRQACQDLKRHLGRRGKLHEEEIRLQRELAVERHTRLLMAIWPKAVRGNRGDVAEAARLVDRIADLYGVRQAAKLGTGEHSTADESGVLAKLGEPRLVQLVKDVFGGRGSG